jgi:hypothetical protein
MGPEVADEASVQKDGVHEDDVREATDAGSLAPGVDRRARVVLWILVLASGAWLLYQNRNLWFGGDDWFIILDRRLNPGPGQLGIWDAHNEHWVTVPVLLWRALMALVGVRHYWPYALATIVAHCAVIALLWVLMVRARIRPWVALGFTALTAIPGVGLENLTAAWQVTLVASLALGLAALVVTPERGSPGWRDGVAAVLLTIGVMCSGVGITMLGVVLLVVVVRRDVRSAIAVGALPTLAYAVWYATYGRKSSDVTALSYRSVPRFVWDGITGAIGELVRSRPLGIVIVLATAAWLVWQLTRRPMPRSLLVPGALAAGAVVSLALEGWRRGSIASPTLSRYAYITVALLLPLLAAAADWLLVRVVAWSHRPTLVTGLAAVLLVAVFVGQVRMFNHWIDHVEVEKHREHVGLLNAAAIAREGRRLIGTSPLSEFEPQVTVDKIAELDRDGSLPSLDHLRAADRNTMLGRLLLTVTPQPLAGFAVGANAVHLGEVRNAGTTTDANGCLVVDVPRRGTVELRTTGDTAVGISAPGPIEVHVAHVGDRAAGDDRRFPVEPGTNAALDIGTLDRDSAVLLSLPRGTTTLCGVTS